MEQFFFEIGEWMRAAGPWAYVVAPLVMAGVAIFPIPAEAPAMINGVLFGPVIGTVITWTGSMLGAVASFELARAFGRPVANKFLRPRMLARADELALDTGWQALLVARFIPLIAFTALNWGAGLTLVRRPRFLWTTAVGILPGAIVFTTSGWGLTRVLERLPWIGLGAAALLAAWFWWRRRNHDPADVRDPTPDTDAGSG